VQNGVLEMMHEVATRVPAKAGAAGSGEAGENEPDK
jgi:hypothetical protein